jgi:hypothetical protein
MKKIMFNDRYGLTQAVIEGRKTVTRRIVSDKLWDRWTDYDDFCNSVSCGPSTPVVRQYYNEFEFFKDNLPYRIGEIVAVAQCYADIHSELMIGDFVDARYDSFKNAVVHDKAGWHNKMFVQADLMPHQIRITSVRPERLQDITDEDCLKEGVRFVENSDGYFSNGMSDGYTTPISAFAALIDKISGRRIWERNPFVWRIEFKLVK